MSEGIDILAERSAKEILRKIRPLFVGLNITYTDEKAEAHIRNGIDSTTAELRRERDEAIAGENRGYEQFSRLASILGMEVWEISELVDKVSELRKELEELRQKHLFATCALQRCMESAAKSRAKHSVRGHQCDLRSAVDSIYDLSSQGLKHAATKKNETT